MNSIFWLWTAFSILAALIFSALVWFGGPLVFVMDAQPFESGLVRGVIIAAIWLVVIGAILWRFLRRRRAAAALEKAITTADVEESDAPVLKGKMEDAIQTLRRSSKSGAGALYELPWYLIIGPPGAGKTTALVNSGLKFPLARDNAAKAIEGVGGTRYCDWWFTEQAVLIDTAGRYTTQDSDAKVDRKSWLAFLEMLRRNRPRQPINGVIVAISIADLLDAVPGGDQRACGRHPQAARRAARGVEGQLPRLRRLHQDGHDRRIRPVFRRPRRKQAQGGVGRDLPDRGQAGQQRHPGARGNGSADPAHFRRNGRTPAGGARSARARHAVRLPRAAQPRSASRSANSSIGSSSRRDIRSTATLRGFYFTSGTQEGTPLDAVIGALQRSYGVESRGGRRRHSGMGKSYFLHDLLAKVIFARGGLGLDQCRGGAPLAGCCASPLSP